MAKRPPNAPLPPARLPGEGKRDPSDPLALWFGVRYRPEKGTFSYVIDTVDGSPAAVAQDDDTAHRIARGLNLLDEIEASPLRTIAGLMDLIPAKKEGRRG